MISTPIQIRFSDCDMLQHVNNAIYLQYFETARIHFFKSELPNWDWKEKGIIMLKNEVEYKLPLFLTDTCFIELSCTHIGTKSFTFYYEVKVKTDKGVITKSTGSSVMVCYNFLINKSINVPHNLKLSLEKHSKIRQ